MDRIRRDAPLLFAFGPLGRHGDPLDVIISTMDANSKSVTAFVQEVRIAEKRLTAPLSEAEARKVVPRNDRLSNAVMLCQSFHQLLIKDLALINTDVHRPAYFLIRALANTVNGGKPEVLHGRKGGTAPPQQNVIIHDLPPEVAQQLAFPPSRGFAYDTVLLRMWRLKPLLGVPHLQLALLIETAEAIGTYIQSIMSGVAAEPQCPAVTNLMHELVAALRAWMNRKRSPLLHESWTEARKGRPVVIYRDFGRAIVVAAFHVLRDSGVEPWKAADWVEKELAGLGLKARISEGRNPKTLAPVRASNIRYWSERLSAKESPLGWMSEIYERLMDWIKTVPPFYIAKYQHCDEARVFWERANTIHTARFMLQAAGSFWIE